MMRHHQIEPFAQDRGAVLGGTRAPGGPGGLRGFDRAPRLGGAHRRNRADALARRRIVDGIDVAAVRLGPDTVNEGVLAEKGPLA